MKWFRLKRIKYLAWKIEVLKEIIQEHGRYMGVEWVNDQIDDVNHTKQKLRKLTNRYTLDYGVDPLAKCVS
jgi:hypothetical protein